MDLRGKKVVVTGAGSGIGRAVSTELALRGATVAACDLDQDSARATVERLASKDGRPHRAFAVDVADEGSVNALAVKVVDTLGGVDVVVNNAGVFGQVAPIDELSTEELRWVIGIDMWGVIYGTRAFLPHLKQRPEAALVNVSSLAGLMGSLGNAGYYAAKFAVRGFSESVRSELQRTNVRVTIVFPGIVRTNLAASHPGYTAAQRAEATRRYHAQPGVSRNGPAPRSCRESPGAKRGCSSGPTATSSTNSFGSRPATPTG